MNKRSVVVANTFTTNHEMAPYGILARNQGAQLLVTSMHGSYGSVHGVPEETTTKMKARWEPYRGEL